MGNKRDFLSITDLNAKEIWQVFSMAKKLKAELKENGSNQELLKNKTMAMIFEKPSLRTRLSFETGMSQFGGHAIYLASSDIELGVRESIADVAKVASSMADIIMARTYKHETVTELAKHSKVPVINGLSNLEHPCQALADFLTIWEVKSKLKGLTLAYLGDGENNVPHSLVLGCALLGINFKCASPKGYWMNNKIVKKAKELAHHSGAKILETENPKLGVNNADIVYTDTWISMGDAKEQKKRLKIFKPYQVNKSLMKFAKKDAIFMHDLPAYRGNEVTTEVIDGPNSVVFQQAENRLHIQKALILNLLENSILGIKDLAKRTQEFTLIKHHLAS